jgi:hypothetical protein
VDDGGDHVAAVPDGMNELGIGNQAEDPGGVKNVTRRLLHPHVLPMPLGELVQEGDHVPDRGTQEESARGKNRPQFRRKLHLIQKAPESFPLLTQG